VPGVHLELWDRALAILMIGAGSIRGRSQSRVARSDITRDTEAAGWSALDDTRRLTIEQLIIWVRSS
jgi:hypothetical protein